MLSLSLRRLTVLSIVLFSAALAKGDLDATSVANQNFQSALAYERLGRYEEAYTHLQVAANLAPEDSSVALALGVVASRLGRYDEALRSLEHAIALEANSCASYYELGFLYEKKGLNDRAADAWQRFRQLTPDAVLKAQAQKHIDYLESLNG